MTGAQRDSDWLANADKADDKEVEDEFDPDDDIVQDTGFSHLWVQTKSKINKQPVSIGELMNLQLAYTPVMYSEELCNGDSADNRDIHEDEDMNDDVVDYNG